MTLEQHYRVTNDEVDNGIAILGEKLIHDNYIPELILYIPRGGLTPAIKLRDYLKERNNIDYLQVSSVNVYTFYRKKRLKMPFRLVIDKKYLIVDDIFDTGQTYKQITDALRDKFTVRYAFLFMRDPSKLSYYAKQEIYYGHQCKDDRWLDFPWEIERDHS